jgi:hypothetical protein
MVGDHMGILCAVVFYFFFASPLFFALTHPWYAPIHRHGGLLFASFYPHSHLICTHSRFFLPSPTLDMHPFMHTVVSFSFCWSFVLYALTHTWYAPTHTHGGLLFVLAWRLFFLPSLTLDMYPFTLVVCSLCPHPHLICTHSYTRWSPLCSCL